MGNTNAENTHIEIIGGMAPSGKWVFFLPDMDLSHLDESKVQRFTFEVEPALTRHSVAANGHAYEVLERLGLTSGLDGTIAPGTYSAALRLATALLRCRKMTTPDGDTFTPTVGEIFTVPSQVLQQYQYLVGQTDALTKEDLGFFNKPAMPADSEAEESKSEKTESGS